MSQALNPDAVAFVPPGFSSSGGAADDVSATSNHHLHAPTPGAYQPHPSSSTNSSVPPPAAGSAPWMLPTGHASIITVYREFKQLEKEAVDALGPNPSTDAIVAALTTLDDHLLRATVYAYENAFGALTPIALVGSMAPAPGKSLDPARNAAYVARVASELAPQLSNSVPSTYGPSSPSPPPAPFSATLSQYAEKDLTALKQAISLVLKRIDNTRPVKATPSKPPTPDHKAASPAESGKSPMVGSTLADKVGGAPAKSLRETLVTACSPLYSDDIGSFDYDLATSVAATLLHVYAVSWMLLPEVTIADARDPNAPAKPVKLRDFYIASQRLTALRGAIVNHRGAGCFMKCLLPMLAVNSMVAEHAEECGKGHAAVQWSSGTHGAFIECVNAYLTQPLHGHLTHLARDSARIMLNLAPEVIEAIADGRQTWDDALQTLDAQSPPIAGKNQPPQHPQTTSSPVLSAVVLREALVGSKEMLRLAMLGSARDPTRSIAAVMVGAPIPITYGGGGGFALGGTSNPLINRTEVAPRGQQHHQSGATSVHGQSQLLPVTVGPSKLGASPMPFTTSPGRSPAGVHHHGQQPQHLAASDGLLHDGLASPMPAMSISATLPFPLDAPIHTTGTTPHGMGGEYGGVGSNTSSGPAGVLSGAPSVMGNSASHMDALLHETARYDAGVMLAFALAAMTECDSVTVATAKRAVEAVECASDGDASLIEAAVQRKPRHPLRDYLAVCAATINTSKPAHREHVKNATERVLAREHAAAHATTLHRSLGGGSSSNSQRGGGGGSGGGGGAGGLVSSGASSGQPGMGPAAQAAARYTKKLPALGGRGDPAGSASPSAGLRSMDASGGAPGGSRTGFGTGKQATPNAALAGRRREEVGRGGGGSGGGVNDSRGGMFGTSDEGAGGGGWSVTSGGAPVW
jgi:hypothetical protein